MREMRAFASSSTLLLASLLAHILAGGNSFSIHSGVALIFVAIAIAVVLNRKSGDPVRVVLAIFVAQNLGHFLLGGGPDSSAMMVISHLLAGALSYRLIRYFDETLPSLGAVFISYIAPTFSLFLGTFCAPKFLPSRAFQLPVAQRISFPYSLRAPPTH